MSVQPKLCCATCWSMSAWHHSCNTHDSWSSCSAIDSCPSSDYCSRSVDRTKYQIQIPLPPKIDPTVTMMTVEEKPDVTYADIGGCKVNGTASMSLPRLGCHCTLLFGDHASKQTPSGPGSYLPILGGYNHLVCLVMRHGLCISGAN